MLSGGFRGRALGAQAPLPKYTKLQQNLNHENPLKTKIYALYRITLSFIL